MPEDIKQFPKSLVLLAAICIVSIPVWAAFHIAALQSLQQQEREASKTVGTILFRADQLGEQLIRAETSIRQFKKEDVCTPAYLRQLARLTIENPMIVGMGYVRDDKLICSSFGDTVNEVELGPVDFRSTAGRDTRIGYTVQSITNKPLNFLTQPENGFTSIISPDLLIAMIGGDPSTSLGLLSASTGKHQARQGNFETAWHQRLVPDREIVFSDEKYVVAIRKSDKFDLAAYAAIPISAVTQGTAGAILMLVPLGIGAGLLLAYLVYRFTRHRMSMQWQLRQAIRQGELFLVYQPVVDLRSERWVGAEALLRWRRSDNTMVSPDVFIPLAERHHLINDVTKEVIRIFVRDLQALLRERPEFHISINFSSDDLRNSQMIDLLQSAMLDADIQPCSVQVEATERGFLDVELSKIVLQSLRSKGISCVIDDFGTGYSSLSYLTDLDVDGLKIDKSFVETIGTDAVTSQVISHIIEIAKSLNLIMIAEGVETREQSDYLLDHGVQYAQGWLFAKPLTAADLLKRISQDNLQ